MTPRTSVEYALRILADHYGIDAHLHDDAPDELERNRPSVDFAASATDGLVVAVEHTLHEPYEGYLADEKLMYKRLEPVREALAPVVDVDFVLDLSIQPGTSRQLRTSAIDDLIAWAVATVPVLAAPPNHYSDWLQPPKGPRVRLWKWPRMHPGPPVRFRIDVDTSKMEEMSDMRTARALGDKLPKLEAARHDIGAAATVLVLESGDWQMTDHHFLGEKMRQGLTRTGLPVPDFILAVDTAFGDEPSFANVYRAAGVWLTPYAHHQLPHN